MAVPPVIGRHLATGIVNVLLLTLPSLVIVWLAGDGWSLTLAAVPLVALLGLLYRAGLEAPPWCATLGERWLGLAVTTLAGERLSARRAAARTLPFWGGALVAMLTPDPRHVGLHIDRLAGGVGLPVVVAAHG